MKKYLAIFSDTINDIEINGFRIMDNKEFEEYEEMANDITWSFSYLLNDQELEFSNGEDLLERIEFKELTSEEEKNIKRLFNNEFGIFIEKSFLVNLIGEDVIDEETELDEYDDDYEDESKYYEDDNY